MSEHETKLAHLWCDSYPTQNGRMRHRRHLPDSVARVAVRGQDLASMDAPMQFCSSKWTLRRHLEISRNPHWLCVLFEPPGDDGGKGFKRGGMWQPSLETFQGSVEYWLEQFPIVALELGNELGVVAQGPERAARYSYILELAEYLMPWMQANYPKVDLILGGCDGLDENDSLVTYALENAPAKLLDYAYIDYHPMGLAPEVAAGGIELMQRAGVKVVIGEYFSQPEKTEGGQIVTSFCGTLAMAGVAKAAGLKYFTAFQAFFEREWGHSKWAETSGLAVVGPGGKLNQGHLAELWSTVELLSSEAVEPPVEPPIEPGEPTIEELAVSFDHVANVLVMASERLGQLQQGEPPVEPPTDPPPTTDGPLSLADQRAVVAIHQRQRIAIRFMSGGLVTLDWKGNPGGPGDHHGQQGYETIAEVWAKFLAGELAHD